MSVWYIGPVGSDTTGDGTSGNPYATISKCLTVGANGDTIKALTGTYTISSTTNINKQVVITSNSGVITDVIFSSNCTIFNIQESNVSINYVTLRTSAVSEIVNIDRMSTGTTVPTFWTGINISNCTIKYVTTALTLNGTFTVNTNTFTRNSGSNNIDMIKVYSSRGTCSISSNTFTDSGPVQYVINLTSTGSGTYLDRCNSKGGTLIIASNTLTFTYNGSQAATFVYMNYFNQFNYETISPDAQYNPNTRISLIINNNTLSLVTISKGIYIDTTSNSDYNTFGLCAIYSNTVSSTDHGIVHLGKNTTSHSVVTIPNTDLNRPIFKIYSNTLNTVVPPTSYFIDLSVSGTARKSDNTIATIGDNITYLRLSNGSASNQTTRDTDGQIDGNSKLATKYGITTAAPDSYNGLWNFPTLGSLGYSATTYYDWAFFCVMSVDPAKLAGWGFNRLLYFENFFLGQYASTNKIVISSSGDDGNGVESYNLTSFTTKTGILCFKIRPKPSGGPNNYMFGRVESNAFVEDDANVRYQRTLNLSINKTSLISLGKGGGEITVPAAISEIRFYPSVLSDSEFMSIYNELKTKWSVV